MANSECGVKDPGVAVVEDGVGGGRASASALALLASYAGESWRGVADEVQRMRDEWDR